MLVIIVASFWPAFACTMSGVRNVEKRFIDSAKMLCVNKFTMLYFHLCKTLKEALGEEKVFALAQKTVFENFTRTTSHKITKNLFWETILASVNILKVKA
jgi:hypothetical protein